MKRKKTRGKIMELYIIRHGDPDYVHDTLTPKGWEEANALVPRLKALSPTDFYASPLGRAQDTAKPAAEALGLKVQIEDWLREDVDYMPPPAETDFDAGFSVTIEGGARLIKDYAPFRKELVERLIANSDNFLARHGYKREGLRYRAVSPNARKVCCFCHGGFGSAWISHLLGNYPVFNWYQFQVLSSSVTLFRFDADGSGYCVPCATYIGDVSHLWQGGKQ